MRALAEDPGMLLEVLIGCPSSLLDVCAVGAPLEA